MINNRQQSGRRRGRGGQRQQGGGGGRPETGNRIDNRARGNAPQMLEKYKTLARDAQQSGDRVLTEYYLQFADHYFRVLSDNRARMEENQAQRRAQGDYANEGSFDGDDGYDGEELDEFDLRQPSQPRQQPQQRDSRQWRDNRDNGRDNGRDNARETGRDNGREYGARENGRDTGEGGQRGGNGYRQDDGYRQDNGYRQDGRQRDDEPRQANGNGAYRDAPRAQQGEDDRPRRAREDRPQRDDRVRENRDARPARQEPRDGDRLDAAMLPPAIAPEPAAPQFALEGEPGVPGDAPAPRKRGRPRKVQPEAPAVEG